MVTCYTPNSQNELARLSYRMEWEDAFLSYLKGLDQNKPLILCGDLNVAHEEIDLKNPKTNRKNAGFTDEERTKMTALLSAGFTDTSVSYTHLDVYKRQVRHPRHSPSFSGNQTVPPLSVSPLSFPPATDIRFNSLPAPRTFSTLRIAISGTKGFTM